MLSIPSVPNLRDLGGLPVAGGTVRPARLFRSVELAKVTDADLPAVRALGLRTVVDLRTAGECAAAPDRLLDGVQETRLDVLADSPVAMAARVPELLADPAAALAGVDEEQLLAAFDQTYRGLVTLPSAVAAYRAFVDLLADPASSPLLFHCTTGKDRTGWAAAVALSILGADRSTVMADYLRTNDDLLPALDPMLRAAVAGGVDETVMRTVLGVRAEFLEAAFDEVDSRHGSMDGYLHEVLGVDDGLRTAIRTQLIDP